MNSCRPPDQDRVHYRIGSLEKSEVCPRADKDVHYRIGSLEIAVI